MERNSGFTCWFRLFQWFTEYVLRFSWSWSWLSGLFLVLLQIVEISGDWVTYARSDAKGNIISLLRIATSRLDGTILMHPLICWAFFGQLEMTKTIWWARNQHLMIYIYVYIYNIYITIKTVLNMIEWWPSSSFTTWDIMGKIAGALVANHRPVASRQKITWTKCGTERTQSELRFGDLKIWRQSLNPRCFNKTIAPIKFCCLSWPMIWQWNKDMGGTTAQSIVVCSR